MAETADDPSSERGLLHDEYLFVLKACKSQALAKELLREYLAEQRIRWHCWKLEYLTGNMDRARQFFWLRDEHSTIDIDWLNSSATRSAPSWQVMEDDDGQVYPVFLSHQPRVKLQVSLIRLNHADVLAMLRNVGLMPLATVPVTEEPAPTPNDASPPVTETPKKNEETLKEKLVPKDWLGKAVNDHPQGRRERPADYARRLHEEMSQAYGRGEITAMWPVQTVSRRLRDLPKANSGKTRQKIRQNPAKPGKVCR